MSLTPELLLSAYANGAFPMCDPEGNIGWYTADPRGVVPLDQRFHVPGTLRQLLQRMPPAFDVKINSAFETTMRQCMLARASSWISEELIEAYTRLHQVGHAHSVECWQNHLDEPRLVGGLYGVSLGGAFFGESMFHTQRDASKVALVALVERLRARKFVLLDTQNVTPHLARFGCYEIPAREYMKLLEEALTHQAEFV